MLYIQLDIGLKKHVEFYLKLNGEQVGPIAWKKFKVG